MVKRPNLWKSVGILAIIGVSIYLIKTEPLKLGLDLKGGTYLVLQCKETKVVKIERDTVNKVIEIMRNRVDNLGVTEPVIQSQGKDRIVVELPGIKDPQRAIDVIGKTAMLEFRDENEKVVLTGGDLKSNSLVQFDDIGNPFVSIEFKKKGARIFADYTARNVGRILSIVLDNKVISAPKIDEPIPRGKARITGRFTLDEAQKLAILLNAGALPIPVDIIENRTVGPTLGKDSIEKGIVAGKIGLILVVVFMALYYQVPGILADVALCIYITIVLAALSALRATLTLPGIAGLILSIGMAVDANVIIFERFKEELRGEKTIRSSIEAGFIRAFTTIVDSNVTTLIAAFVLYLLGTGPIRGFAVTLSIGILTSMFTAIVVTRAFMDMIANTKLAKYCKIAKPSTKSKAQRN